MTLIDDDDCYGEYDPQDEECLDCDEAEECKKNRNVKKSDNKNVIILIIVIVTLCLGAYLFWSYLDGSTTPEDNDFVTFIFIGNNTRGLTGKVLLDNEMIRDANNSKAVRIIRNSIDEGGEHSLEFFPDNVIRSYSCWWNFTSDTMRQKVYFLPCLPPN